MGRLLYLRSDILVRVVDLSVPYLRQKVKQQKREIPQQTVECPDFLVLKRFLPFQQNVDYHVYII